jgi:hypothetical protein
MGRSSGGGGSASKIRSRPSSRYRQKILESYGYKFLRINRFNVGENPLKTLNDRILSLTVENSTNGKFLTNIQVTVEGLESGNKKECPKCKEIRDLDDFKDESLVRGIGRFCKFAFSGEGNRSRFQSGAAKWNLTRGVCIGIFWGLFPPSHLL